MPHRQVALIFGYHIILNNIVRGDYRLNNKIWTALRSQC